MVEGHRYLVVVSVLEGECENGLDIAFTALQTVRRHRHTICVLCLGLFLLFRLRPPAKITAA